MFPSFHKGMFSLDLEEFRHSRDLDWVRFLFITLKIIIHGCCY